MSSLNAERAGDLLSCASSVLLHSGNVASWNKLRRKGVLTSTDEVSFLEYEGSQGGGVVVH